MNTRTITLVIAFVSLLSPPIALAQISTPVPGSIEVPAGFQPFLLAGAEGTQNYVCVPSSSGYVWTFFGPQATLFIGDQQVMTHFLSPNPDESGAARATWQHSADTSTIWAAAIASSTDPNFVAPGAIPWLLLKVMGDEPGPTGGGALTGAAYIQRVNTAGGIAPATGCKNARDVGKKALVPYTTDYIFFAEWHIDTTVIRLLDGTRAYLRTVIDNFSRRILAWCVADTLAPVNSVAVLLAATQGATRPESAPWSWRMRASRT